MGLLNSACECVRHSLLVLLFSDPPYPAEVIVVVVVIWTPSDSPGHRPFGVSDPISDSIDLIHLTDMWYLIYDLGRFTSPYPSAGDPGAPG